ncbi:hypothetical protein [Halobacillus massiliensis]|uniref:hypothetical protein n=1 Tax=Halobacillus massiliensis TaxID=1926286 RepID=UPI0009E2A27D|nr:hypothetical protein [Halobacillus massiliensis]
MGDIKVEFEVKAFGEETSKDYEEAIKTLEVFRTKALPKETTLAQLEESISELFKEVKQSYEHDEIQLGAKVVIRAKEEDGHVVYLG